MTTKYNFNISYPIFRYNFGTYLSELPKNCLLPTNNFIVSLQRIMAEIGTDLDKAAEFLKQGKPVAIPTETVYGLLLMLLDENAVRSIYEVKTDRCTI